ncbi:MAG: hypothetical protein ACRD88_20275, partial [Terriglobia bacterium]
MPEDEPCAPIHLAELKQNPAITRNFCEQLRDARASAFRDAEAFDEIIWVVERIGCFFCKRTGDLGKYQKNIETLAKESPLGEDVPARWRGIHTPFPLLYDLVRKARNDALHQ